MIEKQKSSSGLFRTQVLNSSISFHLFILTAKPHNRLMLCSFNVLMMANRLKSTQLKYLSIGYLRKYIKLPSLLFNFLIFKDSSFLE